MKKIPLFILLSLITALFLSGCSSDSNAAQPDLFQYKDSYIGDNSAVVNTIIHLQGHEHFTGLKLQTKEEPYGITVNYNWTESELNDKETAINNASYLFALIQNADWVTFNFEMIDGQNEYKITREDLQAGFDKDLREIDSEDQLKEQIKIYLEDEKLADELLR